jgi:CHAT domain-containing protein
MDLLSPSDLSLLRTNLGVVALSGCASGAGTVLPGAGLLGLTRGWLLAGARSVVASFWQVPDDDGGLFRGFYRELSRSLANRGEFCPSESLRKAQIEMLRSGGANAEPRSWAAYFLLSRGLPE